VDIDVIVLLLLNAYFFFSRPSRFGTETESKACGSKNSQDASRDRSSITLTTFALSVDVTVDDPERDL